MPRGLRPEWVCVGLGVLFGLGFALVTPPRDGLDDSPHLTRSFLLAEGHPGYPGSDATLPRSLLMHYGEVHLYDSEGGLHDLAETLARLREPLDPADRLPASRRATSSPVVYAPQATGMLIGRLLGLSAGAVFHLGRIGNLVVWAALTWLAIRLSPVRRWAFAALCLLPISVFQAGSLSPDASTNAIALLFVALVLRAGFTRESSGSPTRRLWTLAGVSGLLSLAKPGYWPLAVFVLWIPGARFRSRGERWRLLAAVAAALVLPSALWILHVQSIGPPSLISGADPAVQVRWLLEHPLSIGQTLLSSLTAYLPGWLESLFGAPKHHGVRTPWAILGMQLVLLAGLSLADGPDPAEMTARWRFNLLLLFIAAVVAVMMIAYVVWNVVGSDVIQGVQGRYFLPLAPLLLVAIPGRRRAPPPALLPLATIGVAVFALGTTLVALARLYYLG